MSTSARWDRSRGRPEPIAALNRVEALENGEPLVDLREVAPRVVILREQVIPYARLRVAEMAEEAARNLPDGVRLGVIDAWRPLQRQQRIYEFMTRCALEVWPDLSHATLRRKVNRWVAPPHEKSPPGHCTGAALDVVLVGPAGEWLDVSSPYSRFTAAPTYSLGLTPEAGANRALLVETMLGAGFSNCRDEWWHYSYGDAAWAVRLNLSSCLYQTATLPSELYERQEHLWLAAMAQRPNPFLESGAG